MKMKSWMPLVMIIGMSLGMIAIMALVFFLFGGSSMLPMLSIMFGSGGVSMWRLMLVPTLMIIAMVGLMVPLKRWMMGGKGPMAMMSGNEASSDADYESGEYTRLEFNLPDVSCAHCKMKIEDELRKMPGLESVNVEVETRQAVVYLIKPPTRTEIESRLDKIGYPVE